MSTITVHDLEIPAAVTTLEGFREWVAAMGEHTRRVHFSNGNLFIEMSPQDYETHGPVADAIANTLTVLAAEKDLGRVFRPPSWVTHPESGLSTEPDGFLVLWELMADGTVCINPERHSELLGRPDLALEVVSTTSVKKDTEQLPIRYARAGVSEYWIADARDPDTQPVLRILWLGEDGQYLEQLPDAERWVASRLSNASFRLRRFRDRGGWIDYRLESRTLA